MPDEKRPISRDEFQALADSHYDSDVYDEPAMRSFAMLVDLASHVYQQYIENDKPDLENPDSFTPSTIGGVPHGWSLLEGLKENLEIRFPDGEFRRMLPGMEE